MADRSPRQRMIESAALLICQRGVEATSFADVLEHSGAPRGSIYHHFPGGKAQLAEETTRWAGDYIVRGTLRALASGDPAVALGALRKEWASTLRESGFEAGCPIVAATLEGDREPAARDAAGEVFSRWQDALADGLRARGVAAARARSLAALTIASIEGAILLARAQRSLAPLDRV